MFGILPEGVAAGQQRSSPGPVLGFVRLTWCTCGECGSYMHYFIGVCVMSDENKIRSGIVWYIPGVRFCL